MPINTGIKYFAHAKQKKTHHTGAFFIEL